MRVRDFSFAFACATMALLASVGGTPANAATHIECLDASGSTANRAIIATDLATGSTDNQLSPELLDAFSEGVALCADAHGWSPAAIEAAAQYQVASHLFARFRKGSPLNASQLARLDVVIDGEDQKRLMRVFEQNSGSEVSESDAAYMGNLLIKAELPLDAATGEFVGKYMVTYLLINSNRERFAAL